MSTAKVDIFISEEITLDKAHSELDEKRRTVTFEKSQG